MIDASNLSDPVKTLSKRIFSYVARAEQKIHNKPFEELHFHEVGAVDSIVDIVGTAILIEALNVDRIYSSPVNTGGGMVYCAHGWMPVPTPATLEIAAEGGIPIFANSREGEMTTPTGAAILAEVVDEFANLPEMTIEKIGYGAGSKDFSIPNILRVYLGEVKKNRKTQS